MYVVINHLHFTRPAESFREPLEREGVPILAAQPGFRSFSLVQTAEDRAVALITWEDAESAMNGARVFGPTWFAANIAPYLASEQERSVGPALVHVGQL